MNRRNFFKTVTGFIAGVFAAPKSKAEDKLMCGGQNGTLCPRCKFNVVGSKRSGTRLATKEEIILFQKNAHPMYRLEFNSGEISQTLQSRCDINKYISDCKSLRNLKPLK